MIKETFCSKSRYLDKNENPEKTNDKGEKKKRKVKRIRKNEIRKRKVKKINSKEKIENEKKSLLRFYACCAIF